jgi:hypothetical protein
MEALIDCWNLEDVSKKAHAGEHIGYSVPTIWKVPFIPSKISKSGPNSPSSTH